MKKLLVLMLVLGMASLANATVIDVVRDGIGDAGHTGTSTDPLDLGERIGLKLVLNYNQAWPASPSYDGYGLSSMDLSLDVGSAGTLEVPTAKDNSASLGWNAGFSTKGVTDESLPDDDGIADILDVGSDIDQISGLAMTPIRPATDQSEPFVPADLAWNITFVATASGEYMFNISNNIAGDYSVDLKADGSDTYSGWVSLTESDLGDLPIHVIPEPATIALLGLGGLCLLRRRR